MKVLRFCAGLLLLVGLIALLAVGPAPGPVLRNNAERDIGATALFYTDLDEMPDLERHLGELLEEKERRDGDPRGDRGEQALRDHLADGVRHHLRSLPVFFRHAHPLVPRPAVTESLLQPVPGTALLPSLPEMLPTTTWCRSRPAPGPASTPTHRAGSSRREH